MSKVPDGVAGLISTLRLGVERSFVAARRQADTCAEQCRVWSGGSGTPSYFSSLADRYEAQPGADPGLTADLRAGAAQAESAYADLERYLADEYAPRGRRATGSARAPRLVEAGRARLGGRRPGRP